MAAKKDPLPVGFVCEYWTVIGPQETRSFPSGQRQQYTIAKCVCGREASIACAALRRGASRSCGCIGGESMRGNVRAFRHGLSKSPTYGSWHAMKKRCKETAEDHHRANYFLKGVKVCSRWASFPNFLADMGERPPGTTLDRIRSDGDYEPGNCRWATPLVQNRNRKCSKHDFYLSVDIWRNANAPHISVPAAIIELAKLALETRGAPGE